MMIRPKAISAFAMFLAAAAGGACAQTTAQSSVSLRPYAVDAAVSTPLESIDASASRSPINFTDDEARALRAAGVVRTSVDHRFARDAVTGSFGFLCGLPPNASDGGATAVRGYDPQGRFLGAKLSFAFR